MLTTMKVHLHRELIEHAHPLPATSPPSRLQVGYLLGPSPQVPILDVQTGLRHLRSPSYFVPTLECGRSYNTGESTGSLAMAMSSPQYT